MFRDRVQAGERLGEALRGFSDESPIVLGLPRGGVPVAFEVAKRLGAPLDVIIVRKLGVPYQPELAFGAVGPRGVLVLNDDVVRMAGLTQSDIDAVFASENAERERRETKFRAGRPPLDLRGRVVLLVDDGIATGATVRAAARAARMLGAQKLVVAAPVASPRTLAMLRDEADEIVCLETPDSFMAIGEFYKDFRQTSDDEVVELLRAAPSPKLPPVPPRTLDSMMDVTIPAGSVEIEGVLGIPSDARGLVIFAHGSGSGRWSPRNQHVASTLRAAGLATLLVDLLTKDEEHDDEFVGTYRFDIPLLAARVEAAVAWARADPRTRALDVGLFGSSTGAAAALVAAARRPEGIAAVVSRGGRADLAEDALALVKAPTLLVVGSLDRDVLRLNEEACERLRCEKRLTIVEGATHLFEEPGTLDRVAALAGDWFRGHLAPRSAELRVAP